MNSIRESGHGLGLQVTREARTAGLVEENEDGEATHLARVRVYGFDELLLVVALDSDRLTNEEIAVLVAETATSTKSIFQGIDASIQESGNGYLVQLPGVRDSGLRKGEEVRCQSAPDLLVIHRDRGGVAQQASEIVKRRRRQVNKGMNHG